MRTRRAGPGEFYLTASDNGESTSAGDKATEAYHRIGCLFLETGAEIVSERIFGDLASEAEIREARAAALRAHGISAISPATYIEGMPLTGSGLAGIQMFVVSRDGNEREVSTFEWEGRAAGRIFQQRDACYIYLSGIHGLATPGATAASRDAQVRRMFQEAARMLASLGISFRDVVRTWIYISHILDWYADFNAARNEQFRELGLMNDAKPLYFPASTGIGGDNSLGAACIMDLLAIKRESPGSPSLCALSNPRQSEAFAYHSAFSRGVRVQHDETLRVYVSGCAAIDEQGRSLCPEDVEGQIRYTLRNVESLLRPVGGRLADICEATAFLKRKADVPVFRDLACDSGLEKTPLVCAFADICRPELLFELDALAIARGA